MITIEDNALKSAAEKGTWDFLNEFVTAIQNEIGEEPTAETMANINGFQHALLAFSIFRREVRSGGFVQLIYNGYGPYIFENPFAKALREMGAKEMSKLIYAAKKIYDNRKNDLEKEVEEEELCEIYLDFEEFDDLDDQYLDLEEETIDLLACYVDEHIENFATITNK